MRLNLYWRGRDVIDVEIHAWRKRPDDQPADSAPKLETSGGGQAERAEHYGDPATIAGFGFHSTRTVQPAPATWDEADYRRDGDQALTALAHSIRKQADRQEEE